MTDITTLKFYQELIDYQAGQAREKPYILYEDRQVSFKEFKEATCRAANGLAAQGGKPGDGVGLLMTNCPEYLALFYGVPRIGMYSVPINTALKKEGLRFILENSDVRFLVVEDTLFPKIAELGSSLGKIEKVFIRRTTGQPLPPETLDLQTLWSSSPEMPGHTLDPEAITHLMYTSGTTGFPKAVVNRHRTVNLPGFMFLGTVFYQPSDVLFTALPLFHANALILTAGFAMTQGIPFALERQFSASRFWDGVRRYGATTFNALGAMVPILMKQPERLDDGDNPVRLVITSACPPGLWEAFENRFRVKIWEGYGAVDGGGVMIFNLGTAPVGSVGQPLPGTVWKLVDDADLEVPQGEVGELVTQVTNKKTGGVEYYKNKGASETKVRDGWLHSGDLFFADKAGNLYFVDRKNDSIRRRGENISSFEVENVVEKYPDVAECGAYGVPAELGEDEVMIRVKPKAAALLDLKDLIRHCAENMAHFMVPRFIEVVDEIPRTETLRIVKTEMKKQGVTEKTWDREKKMPDFKLK